MIGFFSSRLVRYYLPVPFHSSSTRLLLLLIPVLQLVACKEQTVKMPPGILSKDKMIEVLVDVHLAEASPVTHGLTTYQINGIMAGKYDDVMKKHNVTFDQFKASFDYYLQHPVDLDEIYQEVVNRLTALEGRQRANKSPPPVSGKKTDSI